MKKIAIATLFAFSSFTANAAFFAELGAGSSKITTKLGENNPLSEKVTVTNKNVFSSRLTVGIEENQRSWALDYTHFGKVKDRVERRFVKADTEAKGYSIGLQSRLNGNFGRFSPYVGLRAFYTKLDYRYSNVNIETPVANYIGTKAVKLENETFDSYGAGIMLGTEFKLTETLGINVGAEYNLPLNTSDDATISNLSVHGGLRLTF